MSQSEQSVPVSAPAPAAFDGSRLLKALALLEKYGPVVFVLFKEIAILFEQKPPVTKWPS